MFEDLDFQASFVDREDELTALRGLLDDTMMGRGRAVFLKGVAGIGKTRLAMELRAYAAQRDVLFLPGASVPEGGSPYQPFANAIRQYLRSPLPAREREVIQPMLAQGPPDWFPPSLAVAPSVKLDEPGSYLITEKKADMSYRILAGLAAEGRPALVIARENPKLLAKKHDLGDAKVLWLTNIDEKEILKPTDLSKLAYLIESFVKNNEGAVVLLEGFEYLIMHNSFSSVLKLIQMIKDLIALQMAYLILPLNPRTLEPRELAFLEREMQPVGSEMPTSEAGGSRVAQDRGRLFEWVTQLFISISNHRSVLLFLDNLHWSDAGSVDMMHYLVRNIPGHQIMVCGAFRPEDLARDEMRHPLETTLREMSRERTSKVIELNKLDETSVKTMIDSIYHDNSFSSNLFSLVAMRTGGNPFYVEEMLKTFQESGAVYQEGERWRNKPALAAEVPESVRDLVLRRIDRLEPAAKSFLEAASVMGLNFEVGAVAGAAGMDDSSFSAAVDALLEARLIRRTETEGEYRFDPSITREAVYGALGPERKRQLHARVAKAIEDQEFHDAAIRPHALLHHYKRAGDHLKAAEYSLEAADQAMSIYAPERAAEVLKGALKLLEHKGGDKKTLLNVLTRLGRAYLFIGDWEEGLKHLDRAVKLANELDCRQECVDTYLDLAETVYSQGNWDGADESFAEALELARSVGDVAGGCEALRGKGRTLWKRGEYEESLKIFNECLDIADKNGLSRVKAMTYKNVGDVHLNQNQYELAIDCYERGLEILENISDRYEMQRLQLNMGIAYFYLGEIDQAIRHCEECVARSRKTGDLKYVGWGLSNAAEMYVEKGELETGLKYNAEALQIFRNLGIQEMLSNTHMVNGMIYAKRGDAERAADAFEEAIGIAESLGYDYLSAQAHFHYGELLSSGGRAGDAREHYERALEIWIRIGADKQAQQARERLGAGG